MAQNKKTPEERLLALEQEVFKLNHNDERHFSHTKDIRENLDILKKGQQSMLELLGGSELNNKKGFVFTVDKLSEKVEILNEKVGKHESKINTHHWWGTRVAIALIGGLSGLIYKTFSGS